MKNLSLKEGCLLAKNIAQKIISREINEYEGGIKIWKDVIERLEEGCPDNLWAFKSNASAIEDCKWNFEQGGANNDKLIKECEQEIMNAAKKLIEDA